MNINDSITQSIDYTSKDFHALRNDLITRIQNRVGTQWTATDPADFGVAIVEAFSHIGDIANYYIDRMANETLIQTATQRQSLLSLANMYGYKPAGYRQASVGVTLTNSGTTDLLVPAGTLFSVDLVVNTASSAVTTTEYFTSTADVTVPASGSAATTLIHGQDVSTMVSNAATAGDTYDIAGELLGYSTGFGNQTFALKYPQVVDGTVKIYVRNGNSYVQWQEVDNLTEYGPSDSVYSLYTDGSNYVYVIFGDNVSGAVPIYGDTIKAAYFYGGGVNGNLAATGKPFTIKATPATSGVTVTSLSTISTSNSTLGYGGNDPESSESIRTNAPLTFRAANRAVSLFDFKTIALGVSNVSKAAAYATAPGLVNVYVGVSSPDNTSTYYPGYNDAGTTLQTNWYDTQTDVYNAFTNKTQIGTTITVLPPIFVPVTSVIEYVKEAAYTDTQVIASLNTEIIYNYGYNYLDFDQPIRPEKLEQSLSAVAGVDSAKVLSLYRTSGSAARTTLNPAQGEYFVFKTDSTKVYPISSLLTLTTTATISSGSFSFAPLTTSYSFTSSSTTFTVTPTSVNSTSVLTYKFTNGSGTITTGSLTSGSASATLTLTTGVNTVAVIVTSADTLNVRTYTLQITK